jgi:hypothetical protein
MYRLTLTRSSWVAKSIHNLAIAGAVLLGVGTLAACGESKQEKAKAEVCGARSEISKQIAKLQALTLSSTALNEAKASVEVIGKELKKIKGAQSNLEPARKEPVEAAVKTFESEFTAVVTQVGTSLTSSNLKSGAEAAKPQLKAALTKLGNSFTQALGPINC